jgi:hypothetical protein
MSNPDWTFVETAQKKVRIISVNLKERHIDALDMETGYPFCLDADEKIDLGKIKKAKIYQATIKIYNAQLTPEMDRQLSEMSIGDAKLRHSLKVLKESGSTMRKYQLTALK